MLSVNKPRVYKPFPMTIRKQLAKAILDRKQDKLIESMYHVRDDTKLILMQRFINRLPIYMSFSETLKQKKVLEIK